MHHYQLRLPGKPRDPVYLPMSFGDASDMKQRPQSFMLSQYQWNKFYNNEHAPRSIMHLEFENKKNAYSLFSIAFSAFTVLARWKEWQLTSKNLLGKSQTFFYTWPLFLLQTQIQIFNSILAAWKPSNLIQRAQKFFLKIMNNTHNKSDSASTFSSSILAVMGFNLVVI